MTDFSTAVIASAASFEIAVLRYADMRGSIELGPEAKSELYARYDLEVLPALDAAVQQAAEAGADMSSRSVRDHLWLASVIDGSTTLSESDLAELDAYAVAAVAGVSRGADYVDFNARLDEMERRERLGGIVGASTAFAVAGLMLGTGMALSGADAGTPATTIGAVLGLGSLLTISWGGMIGMFAGQDMFAHGHPLARRFEGLLAHLKRAKGRPTRMEPSEVLEQFEQYGARVGSSSRTLPSPEQKAEEARRRAVMLARRAEYDRAAREFDQSPTGRERLALIADIAQRMVADGADEPTAQQAALAFVPSREQFGFNPAAGTSQAGAGREL